MVKYELAEKVQVSSVRWGVIAFIIIAFIPFYFAAWYLILVSSEPSPKFKEYFSILTSTFSALGGIGAAIAAFFSFKTSVKSNEISTKNTELLYSCHLDIEYKLNRVVDLEPKISLVCCGPGPAIINELFIIHNSKKYHWSNYQSVWALSLTAEFVNDGLGFNIFNSPENVLAPGHSIDLVLYRWPEQSNSQSFDKHAAIEHFFGCLEVQVEYTDILGNKRSFLKFGPFRERFA